MPLTEINAEPLPPSLEGLVPREVIDISRALSEARAGADQARAALRAAEDGVASAQAADAAAAVDAAGAGEATPKPKEPKARERQAEAERTKEAYIELTHVREREYVEAVRRALPVMTAAVDAEVASLDEEARHLDAVEAALVRIHELHFFRRALDPENLVGLSAAFVPAYLGRHGWSLADKVQEALATLRAELGQDSD